MLRKISKKIITKEIFFLIILWWKKRKGVQKKVTENKLNEYVPINDNICIDSIDHDQVYDIKFQGNPVNKFPLKNSNTEKTKEKNKIKKIFFSAKDPIIKIVNPKNRDKYKGTKITANGIKLLKISSWVKDIEIQ